MKIGSFAKSVTHREFQGWDTVSFFGMGASLKAVVAGGVASPSAIASRSAHSAIPRSVALQQSRLRFTEHQNSSMFPKHRKESFIS